MLRFIISFAVCIIVCLLTGWAAVTWFPESVQGQELSAGLIIGGLGCVFFWATFAALCAFFD